MAVIAVSVTTSCQKNENPLNVKTSEVVTEARGLQTDQESHLENVKRIVTASRDIVTKNTEISEDEFKKDFSPILCSILKQENLNTLRSAQNDKQQDLLRGEWRDIISKSVFNEDYDLFLKVTAEYFESDEFKGLPFR